MQLFMTAHNFFSLCLPALAHLLCALRLRFPTFLELPRNIKRYEMGKVEPIISLNIPSTFSVLNFVALCLVFMMFNMSVSLYLFSRSASCEKEKKSLLTEIATQRHIFTGKLLQFRLTLCVLFLISPSPYLLLNRFIKSESGYSSARLLLTSVFSLHVATTTPWVLPYIYNICCT